MEHFPPTKKNCRDNHPNLALATRGSPPENMCPLDAPPVVEKKKQVDCRHHSEPHELAFCLLDAGKKIQKYLPNGGLMVVYNGRT